ASEMVAACFKSNDYVEGRRAFMEKRKPQFTGSLPSPPSKRGAWHAKAGGVGWFIGQIPPVSSLAALVRSLSCPSGRDEKAASCRGSDRRFGLIKGKREGTIPHA